MVWTDQRRSSRQNLRSSNCFNNRSFNLYQNSERNFSSHLQTKLEILLLSKPNPTRTCAGGSKLALARDLVKGDQDDPISPLVALVAAARRCRRDNPLRRPRPVLTQCYSTSSLLWQVLTYPFSHKSKSEAAPLEMTVGRAGASAPPDTNDNPLSLLLRQARTDP